MLSVASHGIPLFVTMCIGSTLKKHTTIYDLLCPKLITRGQITLDVDHFVQVTTQQ